MIIYYCDICGKTPAKEMNKIIMENILEIDHICDCCHHTLVGGLNNFKNFIGDKQVETLNKVKKQIKEGRISMGDIK